MTSDDKHFLLIALASEFKVNGTKKIIPSRFASAHFSPTPDDIADCDDINFFSFSFKTFEESKKFVSCAVAVSLFRNNEATSTEFIHNDFLLAQEHFPDMFFADYCSKQFFIN